MTILEGLCNLAHIAAQSPVGPAPSMATTSPFSIFDMSAAQLILCNYKEPLTKRLRPYECKVYLWK